MLITNIYETDFFIVPFPTIQRCMFCKVKEQKNVENIQSDLKVIIKWAMGENMKFN